MKYSWPRSRFPTTSTESTPMPHAPRRLALLLALLLAAACGSTPPADGDPGTTQRCEPGAAEACACEGFAGTRICGGDGAWSTCDCPTDCAADGDCGETPATPRCDPKTSLCVGCLGDADCRAMAPGGRCVAKTCVQCTGDADCDGAVCNLETHTCAECFDDGDCGRFPTRKHCVEELNRCVQCEVDGQCSGATPACKSAVNQCVGCTRDAHCAGKPATPKCRVNTNSCVRCNQTADCGANEACQSNQCVSTIVSNDTCANPSKLVFASGTATASGTLAGKANNESSSCGGSGSDVVYTFTLTAPKSVAAVVTGALPVVYISSDCANTQQRACDSSTDGPAAAVARALPAGTYFIWVDTNSGSAGTFTLTLNAFDQAWPTNDGCASAKPLQFDASGTARATSTTVGTSNDSGASSCWDGTAPGGDVVFTFKTSEAGTLSATVTPKSWTPRYRPLIQLRSPCDSASTDPEACDLADAAGTAASLSMPRLEPGTWHLWVDGWGSSGAVLEGDFELVVKVAPGAFTGESCESASPVTLTAGTARTTGTTVGLDNDASGGCGGATEPDKVYSFQVASAMDLTVSLDNETSTYRPVMYLKSSCSGSAFACEAVDAVHTGAPGSPLALHASVSPGTVYRLFVDGYQGTSGDFALTFAATPQGTSYSGADHCQTPAPGLITLVNGRGVGGGTPYGKAVNFTTGCSIGGMGTDEWGDAMNYFQLPAGYSNLSVAVTPRGNWIPIAHLTRAPALGCAATHTNLGCQVLGSSSNGQPLFLGDSSPDAGYYFVWVKGSPAYGGFSSEYVVSVIAE